ncbi:MAG: hypothetical protein K2Y37_27315 [Pirellulales bacterium]|nr:hypothetical protein [Pirellulales bacterium]
MPTDDEQRSAADSPPDTPAAPRAGNWRQLAAVIVVACGVSLVVRAPYRPCEFAGDDMNFLVEIGLARCGKLSWLEGWSAVIGPHAMILWKALFSLEWFVFGLDPVKFHLAIAVVHGLTAAALFQLCRLWSLSLPAAWTAALTWSGAAIGGWDNPTLWIMAGVLTLALGWFLVAMCFAARLPEHGTTRSACGMAIFLGLSLLTLSDLILWSPALLLALSWRGLWRQGRRRIAIWLTAWFIPILVIVPLSVWLFAGEIGGWGRSHDVDPGQVVARSAGQLAVALGTLSYGDVAPPDVIASARDKPSGNSAGKSPDAATETARIGDELLWPKCVVAGLLLAALLVARRNVPWQLLSLFALGVALFLAAANAGGYGMSFHDALNHGHYLYLPCLLWCVVAGCLVEALWPRTSNHRIALATGALLLAAFVFHQRSVAVLSAKIHDVAFRSSTQTLRGLQEVLHRLSRRAVTENRTIRLPDAPIDIVAGYYPCWPLSAFAALCAPDGLPRLEIVSIQDSEIDDLRQAEAVLRRMNHPEAIRLADSMARVHPLLTALAWLDLELARLGQTMEAPNGNLPLPTRRVALAELWRYLVASPDDTRLTFREHWQSGRFDEEFAPLARLLRTSPSPEARYLLAVFDQ